MAPSGCMTDFAGIGKILISEWKIDTTEPLNFTKREMIGRIWCHRNPLASPRDFSAMTVRAGSVWGNEPEDE